MKQKSWDELNKEADYYMKWAVWCFGLSAILQAIALFATIMAVICKATQ